MQRGIDFLKSQVSNAVMQHRTFLQNLEDHERQAEDQRFRDLCSRHIPRMREHQRMLDDFQTRIGAQSGVAKQVLGRAVAVARDLADAVMEDDFLRLVGDIVMGRQSEDTFKTFREAGRALGIDELAGIGELGERHHDDYIAEANRLAQQMFIENARGAEVVIRTQPGVRPGSEPSTTV